jgi:hypothetical protein
MEKTQISFESYMNKVSEANRTILTDLFEKAKKILPKHSLSMKYGFPLLDGYGKFGFAEKSGYVALYFHHHRLSNIIEQHSDRLGKYKLKKESLHYKSASDIPIDEILTVIDELFKTNIPV